MIFSFLKITLFNHLHFPMYLKVLYIKISYDIVKALKTIYLNKMYNKYFALTNITSFSNSERKGDFHGNRVLEHSRPLCLSSLMLTMSENAQQWRKQELAMWLLPLVAHSRWWLSLSLLWMSSFGDQIHLLYWFGNYLGLMMVMVLSLDGKMMLGLKTSMVVFCLNGEMSQLELLVRGLGI